MLAPPEILTGIAAPWAKFYGHSKVAATVVEFLHIAPLVVAGGLAIALDRSTLRLDHDEPGARERHLDELGAVHRVVLGGLALIAVALVLAAVGLDDIDDLTLNPERAAVVAVRTENQDDVCAERPTPGHRTEPRMSAPGPLEQVGEHVQRMADERWSGVP